jgi:hypothetical protein
MDPSAVRLADIEQIANLLGRRAVRRYEQPATAAVPHGRGRGKRVPRPSLATSLRDIDKAVDLIHWLMEAPDWPREVRAVRKARGQSVGERRDVSRRTVERLCLLGSAYKRKAWVSSDPQAALKQMTKAYHDAYELSKNLKRPNLYALLNAATGDLLVAWASEGGRLPKRRAAEEAVMRRLETAKELLSRTRTDENQYWTKVHDADVRLIEALLKNMLNKNSLEALLDEYGEARKLANRRTFASALDQLAFLRAMATKLGRRSAVPALEQLYSRLQPGKPAGLQPAMA